MAPTLRPEPFYFGVPLISSSAAANWGRVGALLKRTLRSVLGQSDPRFRLLLAGHDLPDCWWRLVGEDPRFEFLSAHWTPAPPTVRNDDSGMKKALIMEQVERRGGGLLMYLDADDLVDGRLVRTARARIGPDAIGGIVDRGVAIHHAANVAVSLPHRAVFDGAFHEICGSSTVARIAPPSPDPYKTLGSHHEWAVRAEETRTRVERLPIWGGYVVGTSENHSELHGPFVDWRARFNEAVARHGRRLNSRLAAILGLA